MLYISMAVSLIKRPGYVHENPTIVKQRLNEYYKKNHLPLGNQQAQAGFNKDLLIIHINIVSVTASSFNLKLNLKCALDFIVTK